MKENSSQLHHPQFTGQETDRKSPRLLVLESKENERIQRVALFIGSDIDGTINEEHLPEGRRINSDAVISAREAFSEYENRGILVWLISNRAYEEVMMYKEKVNSHGGAIFEDGLGIEVPSGSEIHKLPQVINGQYHTTIHNGRSILVLAPKDNLSKIHSSILEAEERTGASCISSFVFDSSGNVDMSKLTKLQLEAGHASISEALNSTVRFASAYVANPTEIQRETLREISSSQKDLRLRDHGKIVEIFGSQNHKGDALQLIMKCPQFFFSDSSINSILPVVFGNKENDIEMMHEAAKAGGTGVLVAGPLENQYWIDSALVPEEIIKTTKVAGHGLKEVVPKVLGNIEFRLNTKIQPLNQ